MNKFLRPLVVEELEPRALFAAHPAAHGAAAALGALGRRHPAPSLTGTLHARYAVRGGGTAYQITGSGRVGGRGPVSLRGSLAVVDPLSPGGVQGMLTVTDAAGTLKLLVASRTPAGAAALPDQLGFVVARGTGAFRRLAGEGTVGLAFGRRARLTLTIRPDAAPVAPLPVSPPAQEITLPAPVVPALPPVVQPPSPGVSSGPVPPDTQPPLIVFTSPLPGQTYSGNTTIQGNATDSGSGLAGLQAAVDGGGYSPLPTAGGNFGYTTTFPTDGSAVGPHTVHVRATDAAGNTSTADFAFTLAAAGPVPVLDLAADHALVSGNAVRFDSAASQGLIGADSPLVRGGPGGWTVAFWVDPNGGVLGSWVNKGGGGGLATEWDFDVTGRQPTLETSNGASLDRVAWPTNLANNAWSFVVGWYDAAARTLNLSVNGSAPVSQRVAAPPITGSSPLAVGRSSNTAGGYFDGEIDELAVWQGWWPGRTAGVAADLAALDGGDVGLTLGRLPAALHTGLAAWWGFDEPAGDYVDQVSGLRLARGNGPATVPYGVGASAASADGGRVSYLLDQSPSGDNASQVVTDVLGRSTGQPAWKAAVQNGLPDVRNDAAYAGSPSWMTLARPLTVNDFTIFVIVNPQNPTAADNVLLGGTNDDLLDFTGDGRIAAWDGTTTASTSLGAWDPDQWGLYEVERSGSTLRVYKDGTQVGGDISFTGAPLTLSVVGAWFDGAAYRAPWSWDYGEVRVYDSALSDADRAAVRGQLLRWFPGGAYPLALPQGVVFAGGNGYNAFPSVVRLQNGDLLVSSYDSPDHLGDTTSRVRVSRSTDGGRTWTSAIAYAGGATNDATNLGMTQLASGKVLLPILFDGGPPYTNSFLSSTDNGQTWALGSPVAVPPGYDWIYPYGRVIETSPGGVLLHTVYGQPTGGTGWDSLLLQSGDGGATWTLRSVIARHGTPAARDTYSETAVCRVGTSGTLVAVCRDDNGATLSLVRSTDLGLTWSPPAFLVSGVAADLIPLASGDLLLLTTQRNGNPDGIRAYRSTDGGATWGGSYLLVYDSGVLPDLGYPSAVQLPDGRIVVVYYNTLHQIALASFWENDLP